MNTGENALMGWARFPQGKGRLVDVDTWKVLDSIESSAIARGNARSYGDAAFVSEGTALHITPRNHFLALDAERGLLRAEAGVTVGEILDAVVPSGWFLPVSPGTKFATLGGCIAADVHGKNHVANGTIAKHLESVVLRLADGSEVTCSSSENAALFHATCGGMGLTGIVKEATVRLSRVNSGWFSVRYEPFTDLATLVARMREAARKEPYLVAWIDVLASSPRAILALGSHASGETPGQPQHSKSLPFDAPDFLLNRPVMKLYNGMRFRRLSANHGEQREWFTQFLYPLDAIANWNRLYGPRGFVQYQFAVPYETAEVALRETFTLLAARGQAVFLAVLKCLGAEAGPLSFPRDGVTLAVDLPMTGPALLNALDELDERIVVHSGRVYLAKDSRMKARWLPAMYSRLEEWRAVKRQFDPRNVFQSDLSRRLHLAGTA